MTQRQVIRRAPRRRAVSGCGRAVLIGAALWLVSASPAAADTPLRWDVVVSNASGSPIRLFQTENESCWEDSVTGSFIGLPLGTVFAGGETRTVQTRANNSFGCTFLKNFRDFRLFTEESGALRPYDGITMGFHFHVRDGTNHLDVLVNGEEAPLRQARLWAPSPKDGQGPVCVWARRANRSPWETPYNVSRDAARVTIFPPSSGRCNLLGSNASQSADLGSGRASSAASRAAVAPAAVGSPGRRPARAAQAGGRVLDVLELARRGCRLSQRWQPAATCANDAEEDFSGLSADASDVQFGNDLTPETFETFSQTSHNDKDVPGSMTLSHAVTTSDEVTTTTTGGFTAGGTIGYAPSSVTGGANWSASFSVNFSHSKAVKSGTSTTDTRSWTEPTQPHGTTEIVVTVPNRKGESTYTGKFTIGKSGVTQRGTSPLFRALDMSTSATQPCIGYLVGDASVRQSVQNIAGVLPSFAGANLPDARAYLDDAAGFAPTNETAPCPGFPPMFRSAIGFSGSGRAALNVSDGSRVDAQTYFHPDKQSARPSGTAAQAAGGPKPWIWTSDSPGSLSPGGGAGELISDDSPNTVDTLDGRRGRDLLRGSAGRDRLLGGPGRDILEAAGGNDLMDGGSGDDSVVAGPGADLLRDDTGLNYLEGGPGRDRFVARAGRSLIVGGPGDDAFRVARGVFALDGGAGDDTYRLGRHARADVIENPGAGRDRIVSAVNVRVPFGIERVDAVGPRRLRVTGGRRAQTIVANHAGNAIDAGAGADRLIGGRAGDAITTDAYGADTITTGRGADRVIVRGILSSPGSGILFTGGRGVRQTQARALAHATTRVTDLRRRDRIVLDSATLGREVRVLKRHMRLITGHGARPRRVAPTLTYDTRARLLSYDADGTGAAVSRPLLTLDRAARPSGATFIVR